jgi:signal transduction histidine kinase
VESEGFQCNVPPSFVSVARQIGKPRDAMVRLRGEALRPSRPCSRARRRIARGRSSPSVSTAASACSASSPVVGRRQAADTPRPGLGEDTGVARPAIGLVALLSLVLAAFGWVADRGLAAELRRARREAEAAADETARLAARSIGAVLLSLEQAVLAGRSVPGLVVERLTSEPRLQTPTAGDRPYGRLSRARLGELLSSSWITPSGLPEAVVARLALGGTGQVSLPGQAPAPDVAERLLSGDLPVRPDDLPALARALGVGSDPRVESLRARLQGAPHASSLPRAPGFRRSRRGEIVEGWTLAQQHGNPLGQRLRYQVELGVLTAVARLPADVTVGVERPVPEGGAAAEVSELAELSPVVAPPRRGGILRTQALRAGLWLAVLGSIGLVVVVERALAAQARATAREKRFLSSVTHELRTPLAAMRLLGERLAQGLGNPGEYGALVAGESERLEALVERVLAATRVGERPSFAPVDPAALVRSALELVRPRAERREVTLSCRAPAPLPSATWDGDAVRRALLNLLDNAVRHGRERGRVEAAAYLEGDAVCLAVADDGPGIGPRERTRVFGRFVRGRSDAPGTGLGLHLVEQVARSHGGRVDLVSEEGRGCVFTLRLPVAPPASASGPEAAR